MFGRTCLHAAAAGGNVDCVQLLQDSGADCSIKDKCGRAPLHYAAVNCQFKCVERLINSGAKINETDEWGRTALHYAAASDIDRKGQNVLSNISESEEESVKAEIRKQREAAECIEFLLQNKADPLLFDNAGYNAVHYAAAYGHRKCLEYLLERTRICRNEPIVSTAKSPLHLAAYNGHYQALELLLQSFADVDIRDEKGRTPLDLAAFKGHTECVESLINQGASVLVKDLVTERTPLHAAVINGHTSCLRLLLEMTDTTEVVDVVDSKKQTPLMLAVAYGHIDAVSLLLEKEASVDAADVYGCTALHRGIMTGHEECIQMLLDQEASLLWKDCRGRTPLHFAAARGHATLLSELLQMALSEGDCNFRDNEGYTLLHWSAYNGNENCLEVLLEQKSFRNFQGNLFSPLHCAVMNNHENCASLLIGSIDASIVNCKDRKGRTPLHAAASANHVDCLELLLSYNANVNIVDNRGKSPLMIAVEKGHLESTDILLNGQKVDLAAKDKLLNTALHWSCIAGHKDCAMLILDKIEDKYLINATNKALQTPLHIAARIGYKSVVEKLISKGASVLALDEEGHTPALACAPNKDVADCLALILASMMSFPPSSTMTSFNFVYFKKDSLNKSHLYDDSTVNCSYISETQNRNMTTEDGSNDRLSDSETF
ncbi:serine threonine- phosphatase 6 regulatory ankyrin repeat subunit B isoform X1 [Pelobates cultripes]|nr:serine threonine- phosphatase 6 regulatory ankyrin repeat subunit B isoform X1 [Pelobates cultripes]